MRRFINILIATLALTTASQASYAQHAEVKGNILAACVTVLNPSLEIGWGNRSAITMDYIASFSEEDFLGTGYPALISMGIMGYRYYPIQSDHSGLFVGGDVGFNLMRINKNIIPVGHGNNSDSQDYDITHGYLLGVTVGYKYRFSTRWAVEGSVSGGWQLSRHEGYTADGVRYFDFNASGEWLPYKAAINLSYSIF